MKKETTVISRTDCFRQIKDLIDGKERDSNTMLDAEKGRNFWADVWGMEMEHNENAQ